MEQISQVNKSTDSSDSGMYTLNSYELLNIKAPCSFSPNTTEFAGCLIRPDKFQYRPVLQNRTNKDPQ